MCLDSLSPDLERVRESVGRLHGARVFVSAACILDLLAVRNPGAYVGGFRYLTVDAILMSRPILEKHGFQLLHFCHGLYMVCGRAVAQVERKTKMEELLPVANQIAATVDRLAKTIAVAESSAGGLISAALLSVPGASAYFLGGAVVYTRTARDALLGRPNRRSKACAPSTEPYALLLAQTA